jgi:putative flippase GtrA
VIEQFVSRQFLLFILTGGTAAAVNFGSRIVFSQWMSFSSAIVLAYLMGMVTAYVLARAFVFKQTARTLGQSALMFTLVNVVAVLQTWGISLLLADHLLPRLGMTQYVRELAHAVGVVVPVFTSYLGHKRFSFGKA